MLWANFTAVSKTSPYKTNAPARTSLIVGFLLMACVLLVKEHYTKLLNGRNFPSQFLSSQDIIVIRSIWRKFRNSFTGLMSSQFFVDILPIVCQCWVDSIATFCDTLIPGHNWQEGQYPDAWIGANIITL